MRWATTVLLVNNLGGVLGISRKHDDTQWGLPGGKVDPEDGYPRFIDNLKKAASRELFEETGIKVPPGDLVYLYSGICENTKEGGESFWTVTFSAIGWRNVFPKQQPDEPKPAWVSWKDLLTGPFGTYNRGVYDAVMALEDNWWTFFDDETTEVNYHTYLLAVHKLRHESRVEAL